MKQKLISTIKAVGIKPGTFNIKVVDKNKQYKVTIYNSKDVKSMDYLNGFNCFKLIQEFKYPFTFLVSSK